MGLPWPEWGETDFLLTQAYAIVRSQRCGCGCGQYADESHDEATAGRWQVLVGTCQARVALSEFESRHKDDLSSATLAGVRLLPFGESPTDPLTPDMEKVLDAQAEIRERYPDQFS